MRVTDKMIFEGAAVRSGRAREEVETATSQASTGIRVEHPWDDPAAAGLLVGHNLNLGRFAAIEETVSRANDEMMASDTALGQVVDLLARGREIAVQLSNATYSASDRAAAAHEVDAIFSQAVTVFNAKLGDRYLFGGTRDATPPFDDTGAFQGDTVARRVEVSPGQLEDASLNGGALARGIGGGTDVLGTITALSAALKSNDADGIRATLEGFTASIGQIAVGRSQAGGTVSLFDLATETAKIAQLGDQDRISSLGEVDAIESATRLALAQRALDAALTASARSFQLSLLDKLG